MLWICYFISWLRFDFLWSHSVGWPRGGGSHLTLPTTWPLLGSAVTRARIVPWSYIMNVCTHSYSLVWYTWDQWSAFIDWMALSGFNLALGLTGTFFSIQWVISVSFSLWISQFFSNDFNCWLVLRLYFFFPFPFIAISLIFESYLTPRARGSAVQSISQVRLEWLRHSHLVQRVCIWFLLDCWYSLCV
jgi:hypothetical protein